jgi:hypothetical protein
MNTVPTFRAPVSLSLEQVGDIYGQPLLAEQRRMIAESVEFERENPLGLFFALLFCAVATAIIGGVSFFAMVSLFGGW